MPGEAYLWTNRVDPSPGSVDERIVSGLKNKDSFPSYFENRRTLVTLQSFKTPQQRRSHSPRECKREIKPRTLQGKPADKKKMEKQQQRNKSQGRDLHPMAGC